MTVSAAWPQSVEDEYIALLEHDAQNYASDLAEQEEEHDDPVEKLNPHHDHLGRFSTADGTAPSVRDPKQATSWLKQRWPAPLKVDLKRGDPRTVRDVATALSGLANHFPAAAATIASVRIPAPSAHSGDTHAYVTGRPGQRQVILQPNSFGSDKYAAFTDSINQAEDEGWINARPEGMSAAEGAITHEFGHVAMYQIQSSPDGKSLLHKWAVRYSTRRSPTSYGRTGDEKDAFPAEHFAECFAAGMYGSHDPQARAALRLAEKYAA